MAHLRHAAALLAVLLMVTALPATHAEIIDRMIAIVDGRIVTDSDIRKERQILSALGEPAGDDRSILDTVIEEILVEAQVQQFAEIAASDAEVDARLQSAIRLNGAEADALRAAAASRIRRSKYLDLRFRQFIEPSEESIRTYYDDVFVPEAQRRGIDPVPPLDVVRDLIRVNVVDEELNRKVGDWLAELRLRSRIEIFQ